MEKTQCNMCNSERRQGNKNREKQNGRKRGMISQGWNDLQREMEETKREEKDKTEQQSINNEKRD